jgi:hypothetical protein
MAKETATERLLNGSLFTDQPKDKEPEEQEEVGKPKSRSANAFLDMLKAEKPEQ